MKCLLVLQILLVVMLPVWMLTSHLLGFSWETFEVGYRLLFGAIVFTAIAEISRQKSD